MSNELVDQVMKEVMKQMGNEEKPASSSFKANPGITEFVGTAEGDTIGLVIANLDAQVAKLFGLDKKYRSIGILGARTGAGPQIFAADEAVKATNTEIVKIELPRDTKGGAGHGSLVVFAAEDVSDARRAVEVALEDIDRTFGDVWGNDAGHLEFQYTARASHALNMAFGAPIGKSFGITVGAPAAIGVVLADTAVKASTIDVVSLATPTNGQSFSNEVTATFSGDSGAVRQAIIAAREVGIKLLGALGDTPTSTTTPYI
ncbi:propanediol utilization microcompartment protein PduB [Propionimicrobium lymphophilum]|uniref:propanediol utilization microcompartment protein PduB n=1 Tax=Propionimicrobium lymphophilum TaxID=33012 RepID=UPI0023F5934B|nr:propanediol utilization microcompartment protein PduB [Propionimicrobium lymphophilum]